MSEDLTPHLSPQGVARLLGVGVSTVKRLVNTGRLTARVTAGGHRRIEPCEVLRLVNSGNYPCANPELLGRLVGVGPADAGELRERLYAALVGGDSARARSLLVGGHDGGLSIARLGDEVVAPVMARVGHGWETSSLDVYQEHHGTQTCLAGLQALRAKLEGRGTPEGQPVAVGGGPEGDPYLLANLLIELLFTEMGWRAVNIGPNTPLGSFAKAVEDARPALLWISCSYLKDESAFVAGYSALRETARRLGVRVAVGGNALTGPVRERLPCEHRGGTLAHLSAFVRTIE
jgi:excisionase family DNA binding protein